MNKETHEVKKITAGLILSWIFGILFLIFGMGIIGTGSPLAGIIIILCAAMIIPYFNRLIANKLHLEISGGVKFILVIIILIAMGFAMANTSKFQSNSVDQSKVEPTIGQDSTVSEKNVQSVPSTPTLNKKTEYIKNSLKLENVEVGEGYGQFDIPGYGKKKPTVSGKLRNTGEKSLETVKITVYFLDSTGKRIGEESYYPINTNSIYGELLSESEPLKPNYVRDWGYVVDTDAPSGWSKKVEVVITDIVFSEE